MYPYVIGSPRSPVRAGTVMRTRRSRVRITVPSVIQGQYSIRYTPRPAPAALGSGSPPARPRIARAPAVLMPPHVPFWCICTGGYRSVECTRNRNVWSEASDTSSYSQPENCRVLQGLIEQKRTTNIRKLVTANRKYSNRYNRKSGTVGYSSRSCTVITGHKHKNF